MSLFSVELLKYAIKHNYSKDTLIGYFNGASTKLSIDMINLCINYKNIDLFDILLENNYSVDFDYILFNILCKNPVDHCYINSIIQLMKKYNLKLTSYKRLLNALELDTSIERFIDILPDNYNKHNVNEIFKYQKINEINGIIKQIQIRYQ